MVVTLFLQAMSENKFLKRGRDYPVLDGHRTLPGYYYHDLDIYDQELEKIFYKYWILACREEEIKEIGDFKVIEIGDEQVIIVRNKDNHIRGFFNVCSHRGTQLCNEKEGNFKSKTIRCPYHAWTYDLNGDLLAAPMMKEGSGFSKSDCSLPQADVRIWEGFVFISLDEDPIPFKEQMQGVMGKFGDWKMSELRIARKITYELNCNWKLILQNYQECYHCPGVHPMLCERTPFQSAQHDEYIGAVIGGFMDLAEGQRSMTMDGDAAGPTIGSISGEDLSRIYYYSLFPNMLLTPHPDFVMYHHIIPTGPESIENHCYWLFHPETIIMKDQRRIESAVEFWDVTNKQDWQVCEQMQIGTRSKRFDRGYYSGSEDMLVALDNEVLKALGHERC